MERDDRHKGAQINLGSLSALTSLFIAALIVVSAAHEIGFFFVLGTRWVTLLAPSDYISLAAESVPFVFFSMAIISIMTMGQDRLTAKFLRHRKMASYLVAACGLLGSLLGLIPIVLFSAPDEFGGMLIALAFLWITVTLPFVKPVPETRLKRSLLVFAPACLLLSLASGMMQGGQALAKPKLLGMLDLENGGQVRDVAILRSLDRGLVVRSRETVSFYQWDQVKMFSVTVDEVPATAGL